MKKPNGIHLDGNPTLVASPKRFSGSTWPPRAWRVYEQIKQAGDRGIHLSRLTPSNRGTRWILRALLKDQQVGVLGFTPVLPR
jgi:hypothetical protein